MSENPIGKAIHETDTNIAIARAETRKRRNWAYILTSELHKWAETNGITINDTNVIDKDEVLVRSYYGVRLDAPVRKAVVLDREIIAVWRKLEEPDQDPVFDQIEE